MTVMRLRLSEKERDLLKQDLLSAGTFKFLEDVLNQSRGPFQDMGVSEDAMFLLRGV